jgi:radical SAM superfamily enzyme with C-terminal helix-hairpin-helix motif
MLITLLDGYTDEPSCLGVPPFIAPYPRYIFGAVKDAGHDLNYITIDEFRQKSSKLRSLNKSQILVIHSGVIVPGKYLRGTPISHREIIEIADRFEGLKILGGSAVNFGFGRGGGKRSRNSNVMKKYFDHISISDLDACIFDLISDNELADRNHTDEELARWAVKGAGIVQLHPDYPQPLIAELEASRGCVRYFTGGCSFCSEPEFGEPVFRTPENIVKEFDALYKNGLRNFRLGAQSCIFSYYAKGVGKTETPVPNPQAIKKLLGGIRSKAPDLKILHLDNANPSIISNHPLESRKIIKMIIEYCTSGNILSFGIESADPKVIKANNLNSRPEEVLTAIELINEYGMVRGSNGMPKLLPGLNFVFGLKGESKNTYELNFEFLKSIMDRNLLLRRINLRQVLISSKNLKKGFDTKKLHSTFIKFKEKVRQKIDNEMLKKLVPTGIVLHKVYLEKTEGNVTYARQIATYPLLVGVPYKVEIPERNEDRFIDIAVISHGYRSISGIKYPFNINQAGLRALEALPGIGKKRAARIVKGRPYNSYNEFQSVLDEPGLLSDIKGLITF